MSSLINDVDRLGFESAIAHAQQSYDEGGVPIGAALVWHGSGSSASTTSDEGIGACPRVIGQGHNLRIQKGSAILHAEISALDDAGRQKPDIYRNATIYTTLSPCSMCTGAILLYKIPRIVIGENVNFKGEMELLRSRGVEIVVLDDERCKELMGKFIREKPEEWYEDIGEKHP
ncbi:cytidine deaminase-like protein [Trametes coccinea BRFM310]|uniref:Cytosine deaminase n=1 Tax=Trametes coccinea (strain BRFM310) TaxID=1353009 RepID=A0A1Y2IWU4_TRAC3|nr:cytidine deaminase-like protein [Trametes coccinea BRFM310]